MKIWFHEVHGEVSIDDRYTCAAAHVGTILDTSDKEYIIATGDNSTATFAIESKTITMPANSFLYTRWKQPGLIDRMGTQLRHVVGVIWSKIDNGEMTEESTNAVVGIRG
jgi:hypothetical protein